MSSLGNIYLIMVWPDHDEPPKAVHTFTLSPLTPRIYRLRCTNMAKGLCDGMCDEVSALRRALTQCHHMVVTREVQE